MSRALLVALFACVLYVGGAYAAEESPQANNETTMVASKEYVVSAASYVNSKFTDENTWDQELSDSAAPNVAPSAKIVADKLSAKANNNDSRFDTVATTEPTGTAADGRSFIWCN